MNGNPQGIVVVAWLVAILTAFTVSFETGVMASLGYLGQWLLKAKKWIKAPWDSLVLVGVCFGAYWALYRVWPLTPDFMGSAAKWTLAALGTASLAGHTGGAPATNSR